MNKKYWTENFKDNSPKNTILNIKQYFLYYGYDILEENKYYVDKSKTYWCSLGLYKNNKLILTSNGKGSSEEMSLASGYGELYERYTALFEITSNPFLLENFMDINYKEYQYFFSSSEKFLTENDILNNLKYKNYFNNWFSNDKEKIKHFIKLINAGKILGIPFFNINNSKDICYENIPMLNRIYGTTGYAAGNTFEEAIIQSSAEIFERLVQQNVLSASELKLYRINLDSPDINNENKQIINTILKNNNNVIIYDLSYTYNLPVVMVCLFDTEQYTINFKLGAHFNFNIALERCLTELFQGYTINNYNLIFNKVTNKDNIDETIVKSFISKSLANTINPKIFINNIITNSYNDKIFIKNIKNNKEYFQHLKKFLFNYNYNLYYRVIEPNNTKNRLYSVQCFIDNIILLDPSYFQTKNFSKEQKDDYYYFFVNYYLLVDTIRKSPKDFENIKIFIQNLKMLSKNVNINIIVGLCGYDFLSIYRNNYYIDNILKILNNININYLHFSTPNKNEISKFYFLKELKNNEVTQIEIQDLWKNFLPQDKQYYKDIYYCTDDIYVILKSFLIPYLNEINSIEYKNFLITYCKSME